ncbi:thioredoxin X, chloroplastic [Trifolium pratense]|uniref:Uncharacterized protein n=1 Tax=Trifolium pratense TaxID=57577 RepID=A0ACB0IF73_TRIPR|nr:thioredoxin X, chloroplastic [Trifolium pratense]CAJ2630959.1 unnamed protein product [Trifolium pratense]
MDTITSTSASLTLSLPTVPVRTVASSISISVSSSSSLSLTRSHCSARQRRLYSQKRRFWNSSCSSAVSKFTVTCGITEINESQFKETVLKSERPVLVEFVATWCGPCRLITPAMESLAQEYADRLTVVKIDHDANPQLIEEYKVYGLPHLILFKDGKEVPKSRREGAITKVKLKEHVDALLESISVT